MAAGKIHEQVQAYLNAHPKVASYTKIKKAGEGQYLIDGREVMVGFCREGYLVVHDGPLRQPFTDYIEKKDASAIYNDRGLKSSNLNSAPKETRISFGDEGNRYSRLDAMKVAKEQAIFREKAANYTNDGQQVPMELREKYDKTMEIKLGNGYGRQRPKPEPKPTAPAWWPGTPATEATAAPAMQPPPQPQPQQSMYTAAVASVMMPMPQQPQPQQVPSNNQRPQLPMPSMPAVGPAQQPASLFGPMPDLFQMANARAQGAPAPVASPMHTYAGAGWKA